MQSITPILFTVGGLILFEIVSSIDNAVINAEVLATLPKRNQRWFLRWGLLFAVIGMRGLLPWFIIWLTVPSLGILGPLNPKLYQAAETQAFLHESSSLLLMAAGTALLLIFLYWLVVEHRVTRRMAPVRTTLFCILAVVLVAAGEHSMPNDVLRRAIAVGSLLFTVLFITKRLAALPHQRMSSTANHQAKVVYLEVLDSIFSIEAVLGAFAFTFSVPLILIGNGIGAVIVRTITVARGSQIRKIAFLKRGAMYALGFIGLIMVCHGLGTNLPGWLSFLTTIVAMGLAYLQELET